MSDEELKGIRIAVARWEAWERHGHGSPPPSSTESVVRHRRQLLAEVDKLREELKRKRTDEEPNVGAV